MKITILLVFYINYSLSREVDYCFVDEAIPHHRFGTMTPYRYVSNGKIELPEMPNCKPIQIWMSARHATRYPQDKDIKTLSSLQKIRDEIIKRHEKKRRGYLCDEIIENLKRWTPLPNVSLSSPDIATEGWREGHELGNIYRNAFPNLLAPASEEINSENYVFNAKRERRAEYSMYAFMEGLFGSKTLVEPAPFLKPNYVLQAYRNCPMWSYLDPIPRYSEYVKFLNGPDYEEMRIDVSRRLGFDVSSKKILSMRDMCRYEMAWIRNFSSPWCGIFTEEEWKILEYLEDIRYYYRSSSYGFEANSLLSCFVVQDIFDYFRKIENNKTNGQPKGIFYFSNSGISLGLLTAFGIGKDSETLRADNYKRLENRKFRTSFISPFFINLLATFYRCNDSSSSNKVTFHLNERLVMLEGCQNGICDWDYLKMKFPKSIDDCIKDCAYEEDKITMICVIIVGISIAAVILTVVIRRCFK